MDFGFRKPAQAAGTAADVIKDTSTANFVKDVIEASRSVPVLVDFWAAWCGPCKQLTPILEKVVRSYNGKVRLVKLNVDEHPAVAGQLRIQSLPTVYAFRDGRPLDGFMGAQPESAVRAFIDRLLGEDSKAELAGTLEAAEQALAAGDVGLAAQIYAELLQGDPENPDALAGLAKTYIKSGDLDRAQQTLELVPAAKRTSGPLAGVAAALELARKAGSSGSIADLEKKVAANPADHQSRLDLALALAAQGDKARAVEQLLELFRRDRNWNDQAARKQLLQLFEAWGPKDPHTIEGRRKLSSLMFA
jgi:putative thioredoxin